MNYIKNFLRNHIKGIIAFSLIMGVMAFSLYNLLKDDNNSKEEIALVSKDEIEKDEQPLEKETLEEEDKLEEPTKIYVDIKGAVKNPGVYELTDKAIINDVVKLAGGFNANAYQNNINLSKKVKDEMVIFVYTKEEINNFKKENEVNDSEENKDVSTNINEAITNDEEKVQDKCEVPSYNITECIDEEKSVIETNEKDDSKEDINKEETENQDVNNNEVTNNNNDDTQDKDENTNILININTALVSDLTKIKGIGESKALAIIKYREENGNFKTIEDIKNVSGIGDATFEKIKAFITV